MELQPSVIPLAKMGEVARRHANGGGPLSIVKQFDAPKESLGNLDAEAAGMLIAASADVALVVDAQGVIRDLAFGSEELLREGYAGWIGRSWIETVTVESRPKVEALLRETSTSRSCSTRSRATPRCAKRHRRSGCRATASGPSAATSMCTQSSMTGRTTPRRPAPG